MKKLTLRLEDLEVDAFPTTPAAAGRGTVAAHSHETCAHTHCWWAPSCNTCWETCAETCDDWTCYQETCERSCGGTCFEWNCPNSGTCP